MYLYCKVEQLMKEKKQKEDQISMLIKLSIFDMWRTDLDTLLAQWDVSDCVFLYISFDQHFESTLEEKESHRPNNGSISRGKKQITASKKATIKKPVKSKKALDSEEDMESIEDDDQDDDFVSTSKLKKTTSKMKSDPISIGKKIIIDFS